MRRAAALGILTLSACQAPAATFVVADLKPSEEPAEITGWYVAAEYSRAFRLYPTDEEHYAKGGGQCLSGIASSLAGVPPETKYAVAKSPVPNALQSAPNCCTYG